MDKQVKRSLKPSKKTKQTKLSINQFEDQIYKNLLNNDFESVHKNLNTLGEALIGQAENLQLFQMRYMFSKVITILADRVNFKTHPQSVLIIDDLTKKIETWRSLSDFFIALPWFVDKVEALSLEADTKKCKHVNRALLLIHQNLTEQSLTVEWLAKTLEISTTHLNNVFKAEMKQNISVYIKEQKIKEIKYELKYKNKSLKQVRDKFGFTNPSYFSQYFKKETDQSPLEYMKS